jgi:phosphate transport system permease protein
VRAGKLELKAQIVPTDQAPADLRALDARDLTDGKVVYSKIPGQLRRTGIELALDPAVQVADVGTAILKADYRVGGTAERPLRTFVTLDATGKLRLSQAYAKST